MDRPRIASGVMRAGALPLDAAQARLLALAQPLPSEPRPILGAAGDWLAAPVVATRTLPAAPLSAMDGYAMAAARGPWHLVGESAAGHPFAGTLSPGEAVAISTGAVVPSGADTVLIKENATLDGSLVALAEGVQLDPDANIRGRGIDFVAGSCVLPAGIRLGPAQLALALAAGATQVVVRRRARVVLIDCGDELASPGTALGEHQIIASNAAMLAAMVSGLPVDVRMIGPVPDRLDTLVAALKAAKDADLVVTTGGASVGNHDLVRPALAALGATLAFWRVAIKPGKPLLVGQRGATLILGLPGNPASAFVTGFLFLLPLLRAMLGAAAPLPPAHHVPLGAAMRGGGSRCEFLRAQWQGDTVVPLAQQDSGLLLPLAQASALIRREARAPAQDSGSAVVVYRLEF